MVKQLATPLFLIVMLCSLAWPTLAANDLTVEPDRTTLYEGEVLTLNVRGSMKIDINLGNLFDLDISSLPSPDIEKVEENFEILARNQRYSIRTVNNEMIGEITWTYQLAPKSTGELTIPALSFQQATSDPVTIEVISGTPPDRDTEASRDTFIELATDKDEVYVQEQLVLTIKLFFSGNLIRGELSEPEHPDAIIESLGKQREYSRYRDGVRFRVVERRYAIYPQQPGEFSLNTIRFEGRARTPDGQLKFLRDSEDLFTIPVKAIPAGFTGDTWLPASQLTLTESGLASGQSLATGQNLTRTLSLQADGLPAETLPPFAGMEIPGIRTYPETAQRTTDSTADGLVANLTQTTALVPVQAGELVLPEIRIPWWDTAADEQKVAVIPARTLAVAGQPGQAATVPPQASEPPETAADNSGQPGDGASEGSDFWQLLSLTLAIAWLITIGLWWRARRRPPAGQERNDSDDEGEKALFDRLLKAAGAGSSDTLRLLPQWANRRFEGTSFDSVAEVTTHLRDPALNQTLAELQQRLFGKPEHHDRRWDGEALIGALKRVRSQRPHGLSKSEESLPPLYPEALASRP
ncbi:protein BatD [Marinobacter lipolyticus]|uniref:BatD family protein n=1 Tax=Marinobacter lipolyticus TaxID=209639 RepID=UPI001BCD0553|nr:BatD family protein [Marinobacter lipolyticus]MBS8241770.1 protein BatD [Marinobacter lipolyticus]